MDPELPSVALITVTYNSRAFLADYCRCLQQLFYPADKLRIIFADNHSSDGSLDFLRDWHPRFEVSLTANPRNYGYAKAANAACRSARAEYIALLNSDTRPDKDWLMHLVRAMASANDIGMCVSRRIPQQSYGYIDPATNETSWCSGGQSLVRPSALAQAGFFDERFFMYAEDLDLSWRMWLEGFRCVYVPQALCEHHFGKQESYLCRRYYYQSRNSVLLCYGYGSFVDVCRQIKRLVRESLFLALKKGKVNLAGAMIGGVCAHLPHIPYFLKKARRLRRKPLFEQVKNKWIRL